PLTPEEWEEVKRHPETGYNVALTATADSASVADAILSHHERWDGSGYPYSLSGDAIPLFSRIIALADAFDIMTRGTPYRTAMPREEALREIEMQSGRQFDPSLASLLIKNSELLEGKNLEKLPPVRKFSVK
ncbi:MAG: HD domain-containing protein, partial [Synergistaceae bacterium]|nr:HD domain-containing protein [Synergistaceae bacterium]